MFGMSYIVSLFRYLIILKYHDHNQSLHHLFLKLGYACKNIKAWVYFLFSLNFYLKISNNIFDHISFPRSLLHLLYLSNFMVFYFHPQKSKISTEAAKKTKKKMKIKAKNEKIILITYLKSPNFNDSVA